MADNKEISELPDFELGKSVNNRLQREPRKHHNPQTI
jgi:hypothetical protein